jgi:hypothetical protein
VNLQIRSPTVQPSTATNALLCIDFRRFIGKNEAAFIFSSLTLEVRLPTARRAKITALGTYVPTRVLTNQDLEKMVDTTDQWIQERTGIRERHIAAKGEAASDRSGQKPARIPPL